MTSIEIIPNWHPVFVHFTVALLSVSVVLFFVARLFARTDFGDHSSLVASWTLWIGVGLSALTLVSGWDAYNSVNHDTPSHTAMEDHRLWALVTLIVFVGLFAWTLLHRSVRDEPGNSFLLVSVVGLVLLLTTGYKGGHLVFKYGLGVESMPKVEAGGHSHADGHAHDSTIGESSVEHTHTESVEDGHHHDDSVDAAVPENDAPPLEQIDVAPIESIEEPPVEMDTGHAHEDGHDHQH